jgi:flagellar basal body-associated protein FliL
MQQNETKPDEAIRMKSPETEEFEGVEGPSTRHLVVFVLALIFVLIAGSVALYRYIQRLQPPRERHAWAAREMRITPSPELLSTSFRESIIKTMLVDDERQPSSIGNYGESFFLKPFHINLAGPGAPYAQIEVVIEHQKGDLLKKELEKREPQLREIIIFAVQRKDKEFLLSPHGKDALRNEIRIAINRVMRRKIAEIYIPTLLVHEKRVEPGMRF